MNENRKRELENYENDKAMSYASSMFNGFYTAGQPWRLSLVEAHVNALVGAPLAIFIHVLALMVAGLTVSWTDAVIFAGITWPIFFYVSVGRVFIFRRLFERYGIALDPLNVYKSIRRVFGRNGKKMDSL